MYVAQPAQVQQHSFIFPTTAGCLTKPKSVSIYIFWRLFHFNIFFLQYYVMFAILLVQHTSSLLAWKGFQRLPSDIN